MCDDIDIVKTDIGTIKRDAPYNWTPPAVYFPAPAAAIGSRIFVKVKGTLHAPFRRRSYGRTEIDFEVTAGDESDREYISPYTHDRTFRFTARVQTADTPNHSQPPEIVISSNDLSRDDNRMLYIEVGQHESWSFRYGIAWAESLKLRWRIGASHEWEDYDDLPGLEGEHEVSPPEDGWGGRISDYDYYFCVVALCRTYSEPLVLERLSEPIRLIIV